MLQKILQKILQKMPLLLIVIITVLVFTEPFMSLPFKQGFYALSLGIKEVIVFVLPFIIFSMLFMSMTSLSNNAVKIFGIIVGLTYASNFFIGAVGGYVGSWIYGFNLSLIAPEPGADLLPLWALSIPKLVSNDKAMLAGAVLGILGARVNIELSGKIAGVLNQITNVLLKSIIVIIPVFIGGFVVKLKHDDVIMSIIRDYATIFAVAVIIQYGYVLFWYLVVWKCSPSKILAALKNMLVPAISGFTTMSSAATMPLTIVGVESNLDNKEMARFVVPATANCHLVGDTFATNIFIFAVLKGFNVPMPSPAEFLLLNAHLSLTKFSVAGVPAGSIIVGLPILESSLGFTAPMGSMMVALIILFEPFITSTNILANGVFAKIIDNLVIYMNRNKPGTEQGS